LHINTNAKSWYSTVASVRITCLDKEMISVLPNPLNAGSASCVKLKYFYNGNSTSSMLMVYDATGKLVSKQVVFIQKGINNYLLPVISLKKGLYFIRLSHSGISVRLCLM